MSATHSATIRVEAGAAFLLAMLFAPPCFAQSDWGTAAQEEAAARARVDLRRGQIGLPALTLNTNLQTAARGHANYLLVNNLSGHYQNATQYPKDFTGNTPSDRISAAGYVSIPSSNGSTALSTGEVVSRGPLHGEVAVEKLIQAIYHRMAIFGTSFDEQGAGISQGSQGITVINFGSRKYPQPTMPTDWVGVYPFDGQTGIAMDFYSDEESPDPVAGANRVGYPVSLQIDGKRTLAVTSFTLAPVDSAGSAMATIAVQLLSKAGGDTNMPASAAAIIPTSVLQYGTVYEAKFVGTADGLPLAKTWRFTTAPYGALTVFGPKTAYVGDTLALKFTGGSGRYANIGTKYTMAAGQPAPVGSAAWIGDDGYGFQVVGAGTLDVTVTDGEGTNVTHSMSLKSAAEKLLTLAGGWNLVGNSTSTSLAVASLFGSNASNVITVWKWVPSGTSPGITYPAWAFYAPSLADGGASYAAGKGYDFLSTINAGEGFWVNAKSAFSFALPAAGAVASASLRSATGSGWNLVAIGDNRTPRTFNDAFGSTPPLAGEILLNLTSLWAWDNALSNWYFYAPSLDKSGGLGGYITQKSYLDFGTRTLDPMTGFWVNRP